MIQIDEMVLRVPGLTPADAAGLGAAVARHLAGRVAAAGGEGGGAGLPGRVGEGAFVAGPIGDLRISLDAGSRTTAELAEAIAEAILIKLKIATA